MTRKCTVKNQSIEPVVVMPAIYNLPAIGVPQATWGWHKASELLEAVQAIIYLQSGHNLSADEICLEHLQVDPFKKGLEVASKDGMHLSCYHTCFPRHQWLQRVVDRGNFLPAKVGMSLINAVKHPMLSRLTG